MNVVAQWVRIWWTKESRGAEGATRRNALPVAFRLLKAEGPVAHTVEMREWVDDFAPNDDVSAELPKDLRLTEEGDALKVHVFLGHGTPTRIARPPAVRLARGEWLRWQLNYRIVDAGGGPWVYRFDTLNLAYGPVEHETFLGTPTRHIDERTRLR